MGINKQSDVAANLQIGPTSAGMVRIYIESEAAELPLDFEPDEAEEIAEEILAAAARARAAGPAEPTDKTGGTSQKPGHTPPKRRRGSGSSS